MADKYDVYQDWINSLNPATAPAARQELATLGLAPDPYAQAPVFHSYEDSLKSDGIMDQRDYELRQLEQAAQENPTNKFVNQSLQLAMRARGNQEFEQLVQGGATPEEAFRRTAHLLTYNDPEALATGLARVKPAVGAVPSPSQIRSVPITDAAGKKIGDAVIDPHGNIHASQFDKFGMPLDVKSSQKSLDNQIKETYSEISKDYSLANNPAADADERAKAAKRIVTLRERASDLEKQALQGSTNWQNRTSRELPSQPPELQKRKIITDGLSMAQEQGPMAPKATPPSTVKVLTLDVAAVFFKQAGGNKELARKMARDSGYQF